MPHRINRLLWLWTVWGLAMLAAWPRIRSVAANAIDTTFLHDRRRWRSKRRVEREAHRRADADGEESR